MTAADAHPHDRLTWPAERFLWAMVEAPPLRRRLRTRRGRAGRVLHPLPEGLLVELAEHLPVPLEQLHLIGVRVDPAPCDEPGAEQACRLLVCAVPREDLAALPSHVRSLTPDRLPEGAGLAAPDRPGPDGFELLVGAFEPTPSRSERARRHAAAMAWVLLLAMLAGLGLLRRARADEDRALRIRDAMDRLPASERIDEELARLRRLEVSLARMPAVDAAHDPVLALGSLLRAWPSSSTPGSSDPPPPPGSILVTPTVLSVNLTLEGHAAEFLSRVGEVPGWSLDEPRQNSDGRTTRLALQLHPRTLPVTPARKGPQ